MRVVSLVPSVTETLLALGVTPVACTRFCEQPGLVQVGGTKNPDVAAIAALAPDLVVVNDEENRIADVEAMAALGLALHDMSPRSVSDVGAAVCALGARVGVAVPDPFPHWEDWLEGQRGLRPPGRPAGRVFVAIWRRPWMTISAGTFGSSMAELLGWRNVYADHPDRYPTVTLDDVAVRHPDAVWLPTEPYTFTEAHAAEVAEAVPGAPIRVVDGQDLFWWGIRTPAAIRRLGGPRGALETERRS